MRYYNFAHKLNNATLDGNKAHVILILSVACHHTDETECAVGPEEIEGDVEWHQNGAEIRETLGQTEEDGTDESEKKSPEDNAAEQH